MHGKGGGGGGGGELSGPSTELTSGSKFTANCKLSGFLVSSGFSRFILAMV